MKTKSFIALLTLALVLLLAPVARASSTCVGAPPDSPTTTYPQPRLFVDAQDWWRGTQAPADPEPRHLHLGACIPERKHLSGTVGFDYKVQLHANPGARVSYVAVVWESSSGDTTYRSINPGWTCPTSQCVWWQHFDIPVSAWDHSGLGAVRLRATAKQPNGNEMRVSMNAMNYIDNGKSLSNLTRMPYLRGKGWYTQPHYCEAAYRTDLTPLYDGPVPVGWAPHIRQLDHGTDDANPTHHDIRLDPDIHAGVPGTFLLNGLGGFDGLVPVVAAPGLHKLFVKTDCAISTGTNSGVLVVPFREL